MTNDVDDYLNMTLQQAQDFHRAQKEEAKKLGQEITHFIRGLRNRNLTGEERDESGLWNCQDWLPQVLTANKVQVQQERRVYGEVNRVSFAMCGGSFTLAECELQIRLGSDEDSEGDNHPHYLGNILQLSLCGTAEDSDFRLRVRWLAYDGDTAENGMTVNDLQRGDWAFPEPVWCQLLGSHREARKWLMRTKLTIPN